MVFSSSRHIYVIVAGWFYHNGIEDGALGGVKNYFSGRMVWVQKVGAAPRRCQCGIVFAFIVFRSLDLLS